MRKAVHEVLQGVNDAKKKDTPQALAAAVAAFPRLVDILYYGLSPNAKWDLPEGDPPYKESDEVNTHSLLWAEARRFYLFSTAKDLRPAKRQELFIQTLEFVHPKDAQLLLAMKDGKWPFKNITAKVVDEVFPGLLQMVLLPDGQRVLAG